MTSWPDYPPPAPPKPSPWYRNVWLWISVYGTVVVLGCIGLVVAFAYFAGEPLVDDYYYVDQGSVNRAVAEPCDEMTRAGQDIKVFSTPAEGADALHRFVEAGRGIPDAIDTVDEANSSALKWRDDWITLLDALDSYADDLATDPKAEFAPPEGRYGESLLYAMSGVSDVPCAVPAAVVALDPEAAADYYY
jgi:hypothetical protein